MKNTTLYRIAQHDLKGYSNRNLFSKINDKKYIIHCLKYIC